MQRPIYFDFMATTPVDALVVNAMTGCLGPEAGFGNASSTTHSYGHEAHEAVKQARLQVAELIFAEPRDIVWTSGATEANNLAIIGAARFHARSGKHIVTVKTEHKAVLDACGYLVGQGFDVTYLDVDAGGRIDLRQLRSSLRADTVLVSVMHVNNETGVIQDIESIGRIVKAAGVLFHVDAAQSVGKCELNMRTMPIDLMSMSAHKIYGPKGVGALYVRQQPRVRIEPLIYGGGHERGLRAGTLPTHQLVGMGKAFEIARQRFEQDRAHLDHLSTTLLTGLSVLPEFSLLGDQQFHFSGCLNIRLKGIQAETLLAALPDFALSVGSACNSAQAVPSHVLLAMGLTRAEAEQCLRISLGRFTRREHVDALVSRLTSVTDSLSRQSKGIDHD